MTSDAMNPPRWAEAMLRSFVRPSDRESISGDLLEEYRAARRPLLGALGANIWYIKHVLSVLWQLIRPSALALAGLSILLALTVFRPGHHAPHQSPATQPMLWSLMVKGIWLRQRCALSGYLATRRGHLFRYGLPCVSANSSDQGGATGSSGNQCRRHDGSFRCRRHHHSRSCAGRRRQPVASPHFLGVSAHSPGIRRSARGPGWCCRPVAAPQHAAPKAQPQLRPFRIVQSRSNRYSHSASLVVRISLCCRNGSPLLTWRSGGMNVSIWPALRLSTALPSMGASQFTVTSYRSKALRSAGFNGIAGVTFQSTPST